MGRQSFSSCPHAAWRRGRGSSRGSSARRTMPELGAKGPISQSRGTSHDPAANPWRLPEPRVLSHCRPRHQEPNTLRVTGTGQRNLTKGTDPKGPLHERPTWEETPENLCFLTCLVEFLPAHPKSTHKPYLCMFVDSHRAGTQTRHADPPGNGHGHGHPDT